MTFLIMYVDDILMIRNDVSTLKLVKVCLSRKFSIKDLGMASYDIRMRIYRINQMLG